jgi:hypothetical protein
MTIRLSAWQGILMRHRVICGLVLAAGAYYAVTYAALPSVAAKAPAIAAWLERLGLLLCGVMVTFFTTPGLVKQWQTRYAVTSAAVFVLILLVLFHVLLAGALHNVLGLSWFAVVTLAWCSLLVSAVGGSAVWGALADLNIRRAGLMTFALQVRRSWLQAQAELTERRLARETSALARMKAAEHGAGDSPAALELEEQIGALVDTDPTLLVVHRARLSSEVAGLSPSELLERRKRAELERARLRHEVNASDRAAQTWEGLRNLDEKAETLDGELQKCLARDPRNLTAMALAIRKGLRAVQEPGCSDLRWRGKVEGIVHEQSRLERERQAVASTVQQSHDRRAELETARQVKELELLLIQLAETKLPVSRSAKRTVAFERSMEQTQTELDRLRTELRNLDAPRTDVGKPSVKRRLV